MEHLLSGFLNVMNAKMKWNNKEIHQTTNNKVMKKWMMEMMEIIRHQQTKAVKEIMMVLLWNVILT